MRSRFDRLLSPASSGPAAMIRKLITLILAILLIGLTLMFSAVLLAALVIVAAIAGAWFWWKTRKLRKQLNEEFEKNGQHFQQILQQQRGQPAEEDFKGRIIEGEVIRSEQNLPKL